MRKDPVTPELRHQVIQRDVNEFIERLPLYSLRRGRVVAVTGCVAVFLAPSTSGPCWGRLTLDHVKDEQRMGKRAESDPYHLVTLCEGHTENGARAGYQWNTANRPLLRWYLRWLRDADERAAPPH